jgi:hypothetical protein
MVVFHIHILNVFIVAGIWGSAFCILFKRLLDDNTKLDPVEMIRQEMGMLTRVLTL